MSTLRRCLAEAAQQLDAVQLTFGHGTDNAWDEAVALALGWLDWPDDEAMLDRELSEAQRVGINALVKRRITERIPVPLLLGEAQFAGHRFVVAPNVMIPRSPIAELITESFQPWLSAEPRRVLDLCSGGGCIGISCALQFPEARVDLVDIDPAAVALCQQNMARHELGDRIRTFTGNLYDPLPVPIDDSQDNTYDLIVSNPPYVPSADSQARPAEFLHEPELAYDGGVTGMDLVAGIFTGAARFLAPGGLLVVEVGQWADVVEEQWPEVPFLWPELQFGGEGILVLDATVVAEHTVALARPVG